MAAVIAIVGSSLKWTIVIARPTTAKATSVTMVARVVSRIRVCLPPPHHTPRLQLTSSWPPQSSSLPLISAVLPSPHTCAPSPPPRCGLPKHASGVHASHPSASPYLVPKATLPCQPTPHPRAPATPAAPKLLAAALPTYKTRQRLQSRHASPNSNGNQDDDDKAITMATKTGLTGAVKAMAMAGTVTGAMAGTAVQMAGSGEDIDRNGSGNCNGVLSVASSL
ncbi:hypothetical protein EDB83DRAFT_2327657 [Lactarius deliciosus]|nr:hypothetical protein EDB83DRAFT_2327657 [Lactarius deliciosus]